jgi:hypothetical protein
MLDNSITEGSLYEFRDPKTGDGDVRQMCELVNNFFCAIVETFPEDWEHKPRRSRLVHGVGIIAMGYLMDAIVDRLGGRSIPTVEKFAKDLLRKNVGNNSKFVKPFSFTVFSWRNSSNA